MPGSSSKMCLSLNLINGVYCVFSVTPVSFIIRIKAFISSHISIFISPQKYLYSVHLNSKYIVNEIVLALLSFIADLQNSTVIFYAQ